MEFLPRLSAESSAAVFLSSAVIILLLGGLVCGFTSHRAHSPFPPGPRGIPILGNVRDIPLQRESQTYHQWAKEYGPIVSVHILGQRIVLLNTSDLSRELFESRASLYSHRPSAPMLNMMGYAQWLVGLLNPGDQWKMCRRLLTQSFNPQTIPRWRPYQQQEVHRLLAKLLDDPENFCRHINRTVVGSVMMILYGHRVPASGEDDFVAMHDKSVRETKLAITNGAYLVNLFPSLRHVPEWMPGAGFRREASEAFVTGQKVLHRPMEIIKQQMHFAKADGIAALSYVSSLLEEGQDEFVIKQTAATSYNAGVGTTNAILLTSILAMTLFPEAQHKAQQEIDSVIGSDRLPEFKDRGSLPYTEALIKELFRWAPPGPVALPHLLAKDDVIRGYFIPAGSMIMCNVWGVLHDESRYPKPFDFTPERHLDGSCPDPMVEVFGFGKRVCPGRHLAEAFLWLAVVSVLTTFKIGKEVDDEGKEMPPHVEYTSGIMSAPEPFKCTIEPRSDTAVELIRQANSSLL